MADEVIFTAGAKATPPAGTKIATDTVGGKEIQFVKVDIGADGLSNPVVGVLPVHDISGSVAVSNFPSFPSQQGISGSVSVSNFPSFPIQQGISGTISVGNTPVILFDPSNLSAFGVFETAELTPSLQGDFVYGLNSQKWQTAMVTGTGAGIDTDASRLRVQSGTSATGRAYILSRKPIRYRAGEGILFRATPIFATPTANNVQLQGMGTVVLDLPYDGFFFGCSGTSFGVSHYIRGVPTWIPQSTWNGDKCDGSAGTTFTYDPTKGTPAMIKYPYLGYGDIQFFLQNPVTGRWTLCHTIRYANTVNTTQLSNPTLYFLSIIINLGNTTNLTMYNGSYGAFISGIRSFVGNPKWAIDGNKSGVTTETCLINLKNATNYNGIPNRGLIRVNSLSCSNNANTGIAFIRLKLNATIGGTPGYAAIAGTTADNGVSITNGNSIASFDTTGTTVSGGAYIFNVNLSSPGNLIIDLTPYDIFVPPSEILTVSGFSTASALLAASINWTEDI